MNICSMSKPITNRPGFVSKALRAPKMPAFTLYGSRGSTNTDRVRLTLAEGGFTDYEFVLLNLQKGEQKVSPSRELPNLNNINNPTQSPSNLTRHPFGKIPAITFPSGFTLYESRAICTYLARKYSFPLLPPSPATGIEHDLEATALFDQAQSVETHYFAEPAGKISFELFAKKFMGLPADKAVVSQALKAVEGFFDVAERMLQEREYMAGREFTVVDVFYIPLVQRLFACGHGDVIQSRGAVNAWWERCVNRPAIRKMLAEDGEVAVAAAAAKRV